MIGAPVMERRKGVNSRAQKSTLLFNGNVQESGIERKEESH